MMKNLLNFCPPPPASFVTLLIVFCAYNLLTQVNVFLLISQKFNV